MAGSLDTPTNEGNEEQGKAMRKIVKYVKGNAELRDKIRFVPVWRTKCPDRVLRQDSLQAHQYRRTDFTRLH